MIPTGPIQLASKGASKGPAGAAFLGAAFPGDAFLIGPAEIVAEGEFFMQE
jgi:hypothetical protein